MKAIRSTSPASAPKAETEPQVAPAAGKSWALLSALVVLGLLLPTLWFPYGRDQAVFAYVGRVLAEGGVPYRDAWDLKPPGIYLLYGLLARLVGGDGLALMTAIRVADLLIAASCGALLAWLARAAGRPEAGVAAAAWYAALYLQGGYWSLAQTEAWANPLVLAAALLLLEDAPGRKGRLLLAAAGLLAGGVALLKFTSLLALAPFVFVALARRQPLQRIPALVLFAAGVAVPVLAAAVWLSSRGALQDYLEIQRSFVAPYTRLSANSRLARLSHGSYRTGLWLTQTWVPMLLAIAAIGWRSGRSPRLLPAMLACALAAVWAQDKYFGYHWQTVLPALALLAAVGVLRLLGRMPLPPRWTVAAGVLAAVIWSLAANRSVYGDFALMAAGRKPRHAWLVRFGRPHAGDNSFLATRWAAEYVRSHTQPEDGVLVWGFEPAIYLLANRKPPTRFFFNVPVASGFVPPGWREQFMWDVRARPPELLLVLHHDAIPWANGRTDDSAAQLADWPRLEVWVKTRYRVETEIEDFTIYRLQTGVDP